jgi:hypothetical protein
MSVISIYVCLFLLLCKSQQVMTGFKYAYSWEKEGERDKEIIFPHPFAQ